jgi:hypothetical protein
MASYGHKHIDLVLRTNPQGQHATVRVLKTTAEFYGWTNHFKTPLDLLREEQGFPQYVRTKSNAWARLVGGTAIRIGRGTDMRRNEPGLTNQFRINNRVKISDLAELASKTEVEWQWLERPCGRRMERDWWLNLYPAHRTV